MLVASINGSIQVAGQKIQVGKVHARKLVTVTLEEHTVTVYDAGTPIKAVPRRSTTDLNRTKAKHQITAARRTSDREQPLADQRTTPA